MRVAGTTVSYKLVLPNGYDAAKTYPAILVFGGGPQTMNTIDGALARNFQAEAEQRGYIVIGPAAPDGDLFFYDGDRIFPEFLDNTARRAQDRRRQVPRRGPVERRHRRDARRGRSIRSTSFRRRRSPATCGSRREAKLQKLEGICVYLYIGENDEYRWHGEMEREAEISALPRKRRAVHRREGPAAPARDARGRGREPAVRRLRDGAARLPERPMSA